MKNYSSEKILCAFFATVCLNLYVLVYKKCTSRYGVSRDSV